MDPQFVAWQRPAMYALATAPPASGRLRAELPITLHDDLGDITVPAAFLLAGPGDVRNLVRGQVIGRRPHPGCVDAEATMLAHIELAAPDLPWRYSPQPHTDGMAAVRPWLVLVVGSAAEVAQLPDGKVQLSGADLFAGHPLNDAFVQRWAHVHAVPGGRFARILCPRPLEPGTDYVAALVPGWQVRTAGDGTESLIDSWQPDSESVVLPCFDSWTFRTIAEEGDFATIAQRLEPTSDAEDAQLAAHRFGRADVTVGLLPGVSLATAAALTVIPGPGDPPVADPLPPDVADAVEPLTTDLAQDGRWVLTLPRYDVPWYPGPVDGEPWAWPPPGDDVVPDGWRQQVRTDPRHRGTAGLGAWVAVAWQDRIAAAAAQQAGAVAAAAGRIRHLVLGLAAAGSLWQRRLPTDPLARLAVLTPLLGRMPVAGGGTALQAVTGRTPDLAAALFSSAARRVLRRRGPLDRACAPGATSLGGLIQAANRCPPVQKLSPADERVNDAAGTPDRRAKLTEALHGTHGEALTALGDNQDIVAKLVASLDQPGVTEELVGFLGQTPPSTNCQPLPDLVAFSAAICGGIDPTTSRPVAVQRVLAGLTGLREPVLAEPDLAPELDIPLWRFLSDNAPDWLLPGSGDIPKDRVLAVQSNPAFVDAFLLGANAQTVAELRWRNLPIVSRWTPLRRFWQRINIATDSVATDIAPVVALDTALPIWPDATDLGDLSHLADPTHGASLVIVLHTELFRRYPATLVYLALNPDGEVWGPVPHVDDPNLHREYPSFSGTLTPDLVFFGFGVPPEAGRNHWLVLEEPPPGYRFKNTVGNPSTDGATFAATTFADPVRVFLGNLL